MVKYVILPILLAAAFIMFSYKVYPRTNHPGLLVLHEKLRDENEKNHREISEKITKIWIDTGDPELTAQYRAGLDFYHYGYYQLALDQFLLVKEADPTFKTVYHSIGYAHFALRHLDAAEDNINTALAKNPLNYMAWFNRGVFYHYVGDLPEALKSYRKAKFLYINFPGVDTRIAHLKKVIRDAQARVYSSRFKFKTMTLHGYSLHPLQG